MKNSDDTRATPSGWIVAQIKDLLGNSFIRSSIQIHSLISILLWHSIKKPLKNKIQEINAKLLMKHKIHSPEHTNFSEENIKDGYAPQINVEFASDTKHQIKSISIYNSVRIMRMILNYIYDNRKDLNGQKLKQLVFSLENEEKQAELFTMRMVLMATMYKESIWWKRKLLEKELLKNGKDLGVIIVSQH